MSPQLHIRCFILKHERSVENLRSIVKSSSGSVSSVFWSSCSSAPSVSLVQGLKMASFAVATRFVAAFRSSSPHIKQ